MDQFVANSKDSHAVNNIAFRPSVSEMIMEATNHLKYEDITLDNIRNYALEKYDFDVVEHITDANLLTRSGVFKFPFQPGKRLLSPHSLSKSQNTKKRKISSARKELKMICSNVSARKSKPKPASHTRAKARSSAKLKKLSDLSVTRKTKSPAKSSNTLITKAKREPPNKRVKATNSKKSAALKPTTRAKTWDKLMPKSKVRAANNKVKASSSTNLKKSAALKSTTRVKTTNKMTTKAKLGPAKKVKASSSTNLKKSAALKPTNRVKTSNKMTTKAKLGPANKVKASSSTNLKKSAALKPTTRAKASNKMTTKPRLGPANNMCVKASSSTKLKKFATLSTTRKPTTRDKVSNKLATKPKLGPVYSTGMKTRSWVKLKEKEALFNLEMAKNLSKASNRLVAKSTNNVKNLKSKSAILKRNTRSRGSASNLPRNSSKTRQKRSLVKHCETKTKKRKRSSSTKARNTSKLKQKTLMNRKRKGRNEQKTSSIKVRQKRSASRKISGRSAKSKAFPRKYSPGAISIQVNKLKIPPKSINPSHETIDSSLQQECSMDSLSISEDSNINATENCSFAESETSSSDLHRFGQSDISLQESISEHSKETDTRNDISESNEVSLSEAVPLVDNRNFGTHSYSPPHSVRRRLQKPEPYQTTDNYVQNIMPLIQAGYAVLSFLENIGSRCASRIGWSQEDITAKTDKTPRTPNLENSSINRKAEPSSKYEQLNPSKTPIPGNFNHVANVISTGLLSPTERQAPSVMPKENFNNVFLNQDIETPSTSQQPQMLEAPTVIGAELRDEFKEGFLDNEINNQTRKSNIPELPNAREQNDAESYKIEAVEMKTRGQIIAQKLKENIVIRKSGITTRRGTLPEDLRSLERKERTRLATANRKNSVKDTRGTSKKRKRSAVRLSPRKTRTKAAANKQQKKTNVRKTRNTRK